jgi:hypothetical protein
MKCYFNSFVDMPLQYVGNVDELPLCELEYRLAVHVQLHTAMGVMTTNGQLRTGKGIMVGGDWRETTETYFMKDPNELRQEVSDQSQVPLGSIIYQSVTVNIHYPRPNNWSEEVIADLRSYSVAEDRQGGLQVVRSWKDAVQDAISILMEENDLGVSNWDENNYLGHIKMYPLAWRTLLRSVYKSMGNGSLARDYMFTNLYANQEELESWQRAQDHRQVCGEHIF